MRFLAIAVLLSELLAAAPRDAQDFKPQDPAPRDPRAQAAFQQSLAAMGGAVPADAVIVGTVVLEAGGSSESGTVRILTRGIDQTFEDTRTAVSAESLVFSRGRAKRTREGESKVLPLEPAVVGQSAAVPILLVASALNDPETAFEYLGDEQIGESHAYHIRFWKTFASTPGLRRLAEFSAREIWIDTVSGLPIRISYEHREGGGATDRIPMDIYFSDFRNVAGTRFPFSIRKSLNGTPWAILTIESVTLNTGLADADFALKKEQQ